MLSAEERRELISKYVDGFNEVFMKIRDMSDEQLRAHPIEGKWSACEIVQHLADSETIAAHRLRRLLVEDSPVIQGYDQDYYAAKLRYNERDIVPAVAAFRSARETTAQLFPLMSEEDWQRRGSHSESGSYGVEDWLRIYAAHAHNHASQISSLRTALGI
jgi:hypothetical protein